MFDGKIDFMDFNKIKINYGGKLTCRKVFKRKYIIFIILSTLLIITLVIIYSSINKKISGINIELKELDERRNQIEYGLKLIRNQNAEEDINLIKFKNQKDIMQIEIKEKEKNEEEIQKSNTVIIEERDNLESRSTLLSVQLKTEMELKEVYLQKITSLTSLLESLKVEFEKLLEQKKGKTEDDDLNVKNSKIINSIETLSIEKQIKGTIANKCFDGLKEKFNPLIFHNKCDQSAILVLVTTDNQERIGAFTKASSEGLEIKRDISSVIFNIDKGKYYSLANSEYYTIVCDPDELPQFGIDFQIKANGQGINFFPFNYGNKNINLSEELTQNHVFSIKNLEIYKVNL